jgi:glycosyltransferase involved in cell wall biosynthesis
MTTGKSKGWIAVVTATKGNRPKQLLRAINSVKSQNGDWRIDHYVVCDGGGEISVPDGVELLIREERGGPGAARNTGVVEALASDVVYIAILDDDDWWTDSFMDDMASILDSDKTLDVAYGDLRIYNYQRTEDGEGWELGGSEGPQFSYDWGGWGSMKDKPYIPLPACLFKREYFEENGWFREDIGRCVDWEILARGEANGAQFKHLPKIVGFAEWKWGEGTDNISTVQPEANFPPTTWSRVKTIISGHYI